MSKLLGLSGMKGHDHFKSLSGSGLGAAKSMSINPRMSSDMVSTGSFANLKLTAEKLVKEQASAKTDLQLASSKLKKLTEDVRMLEEKLQNAYNENAKLKVKQKEDEKLWKGLESKFSSTKTLCDQLTETLQHLAGVVQDAEKDKASLEDKQSATSVVIDNLQDNMNALYLRLESSEETVRNCKTELNELRIEKEKMGNCFRAEQSKCISVIEEKDAMIKEFEATVAVNGLAVENLKSKLEKLHLESRLKEDELEDLRTAKNNLEKEKSDLVSKNSDFAKQLDTSLQEIKNLNEFVNEMLVKFTDLDSQSIAFAEKIIQLNALFDSGFEMMREKGELAARHAQQKLGKLQDQYTSITSEKNALQLANTDLKDKVFALQKEQEHAMVQHAEESRLAEDQIRKLESEREVLLSKKMEMELLISKLQENIVTLSDNSKLSENEMQNLSLKLSEMETENKDHIGKLESDLQKKEDEIHLLRKEIDNYTETVDSLEKHVTEINSKLEEKDQLVQELQDREKQLEAEREKIQTSLLAAESKLAESKKQYDQMLESKQLELSRHLKELSQKNDQAISDIRRRYDLEKLESVDLEKEKAEKIIGEMERNCESKLLECRDESKQKLKRLQEENANLVCHIQQEHSKKEMSLVASHNDELKRAQLQYESELREKTNSMRNEFQSQLRDLRLEHEDDCRRLQEELDMQKSKEEQQRALLQLQWKVMGNNPEEEEVTSKKNYSCSVTKRTIILIPLALAYFQRRKLQGPQAKIIFIQRQEFIASAGVGIIAGLDGYLNSWGPAKLPVSTSTLINATQLAFTALFAVLIVKQKLTAYSTNSVVLLIVGSATLALRANGDRPQGESSKDYMLGFIMTFVGAVFYGLMLPLIELIYMKAKNAVTYTTVLEIQMVIGISATVFCTVGMIINKDFQAIPREASQYQIGETMYYMVLVWCAIIWQFALLGLVGVIFYSSSLLSGIIGAFLLPVTEVLAVILFHEKFQAEKGVAIFLALWGFVSYFYGEYEQGKKEKMMKLKKTESQMSQQLDMDQTSHVV